jgi:hypothetical protein
MNEYGQEPQQNPTFVQSATPAPAPTIMEASANESHKAKSSNSIDQDKIEPLEARLKAIEGVDLCHNPILGYSPKIIFFFQNKNQKIK